MVREVLAFLNSTLRADARLGARVYPVFAPRSSKGTLAVYTLITDVSDPTFTPTSDPKEFEVEVRLYSSNLGDVLDLRDTLKTTLDAVANHNLDDYRITTSFVDSFRDGGDPETGDYEAAFTWTVDVEAISDVIENVVHLGENVTNSGEQVTVTLAA